jgi:hypothetical protein
MPVQGGDLIKPEKQRIIIGNGGVCQHLIDEKGKKFYGFRRPNRPVHSA